ncbi:MAG: DUF4956 domain-containing protein [Clostridia bacterium]|nr:DUF4956 domain-containing protein [Clostridia bacterium]MBR5751312.1 DUF4956 domain-containing protein [Clostridia bacterium]
MKNSKIFQEIFQNQSIGANSIALVIFTLLMAFAVGLFIYWVYKKTFRGVMFSQNFALTLILMTTITAPVVLCIRNNVALSMGMVGALSIVRFRTAVKDPLDTAYMFWALTMGILLGAGQFLLSAIAVVGIAVVIFVLRSVIMNKGEDSYLLVVRADSEGEANAQKLLTRVRYQQLKSKTVTGSGIELTYEVRVEKSEAFLNKLLSLQGIKEASLVSYKADTL